ncbi:DUF6683 family protein [Deinococcus roseus]|uniref:DUF1002 domain-containing protein n=1 Tax=Deinococcus roseus TaxID=392414 RepID=A0ABQ2CY47_9DEIO|nr:DUF6683 family protein [Deinococcus roseus]GGJ32179.1 hypothetical protein GCM10008938_17990 [Deinococcus roseus]
MKQSQMKQSLLILIATGMMTAQAEDVFSSMFESTAGSIQNATVSTVIGGAVEASEEGPPAAVAKTAFLTYQPNAKTTAAVEQQILKTLLAKAPGKETEIKNLLKQANVVPNVRKAIQGLGYDPNELAVSLTLWVNTSFGQLEDRDTTDAENAAVLKQFRSAVQNAAGLKKLSNEDRQKTAEMLMYMTFFQSVDVMAAQQNKPGYDLETVKASIAENLKRFDLDPELYTVTETGIGKKD